MQILETMLLCGVIETAHHHAGSDGTVSRELRLRAGTVHGKQKGGLLLA